MPRRSSGGRPAPRAAARPAPARSPPPQPVNHAPSSSCPEWWWWIIVGGIGSTIAQGMAFGTGSAVAHRAVDAVLGPRTIQHETVVSEAAATAPAPTASNTWISVFKYLAFGFEVKFCVNNFGSDISKCQFYMDMLSECRKNSGAALSA
ncbi:hypothetical protein GH714_008424 [Hevea brasiliensis]|uniref:CHCH domain-containing protein n=1 Tax=Hevea brasiliensis TaxID=3981 RepID=A0A6A6L3I6_HEVBR|nr:hypothetical protein GH714_008424 [Hevea brasiliensis]